MSYPKMDIHPNSWMIGGFLLKALLLEVSSYPKPGLVTSKRNGSHTDMSILTFMVGSASISPALFLCSQAGIDHSGPINNLLSTIRQIGIHGENQLLAGTKGVNTQRGALFAAGLLCGAAGYLSVRKSRLLTDEIFDTVAEMTNGIVLRELVNLNGEGRKLTAGEQLFQKYKVRGIRGEVEDGFPSVREKGLPAFHEALEKSIDLNLCLVHILISLMTCVEDTTVLWRKDYDVLKNIQERAKTILGLGSVFTDEGLNAIHALDEEFIRANISPGGCADLVSITVGSYLLENRQFPVTII